MLEVLAFIIALALGTGAGFYLPSATEARNAGDSKQDIAKAQEEAAEVKAQAKEKIARLKSAFKEEEASFGESLTSMEELVKQKEAILARREERSKQQESNVNTITNDLKSLKDKAEELRTESTTKLASSSGISREAALEEARNSLKAIMTDGQEARSKATIEEFEEDVMRHAKAVLQVVIQRLGVPSSVDKNSTTIKIHDEKFKGMLVGKDGKNVIYLESLLPVAVIFNHGDPSNIHVGGVNLFRRNIAKRAIRKLEKTVKKTKRIEHKHIKEAVEQSEKELMQEADKKGVWAYKQMGLDPNKVPQEIVNYVGRLYFRTSYGQNIIHHSLEMAYAARLIAELIGTDVDIAMQGAFYHDLGKAIDHDVGGAHDDLSKEILEKHGFDERIIHAAYAHHDKVPCESPADFIVKAVDAISGGRPGARMESVTNYFERMKQLEEAARSFKGVAKVLTMSAGREVRVLVNKDQIKDGNAKELADNIASKISDELSFPGIIKVNLIRQTKSVDYAREKRRSH
jgi:ribonuclease Y